MAEVATNTQVVLKVSDAEWRLMMKCLAAFAGLKVTSKPEDRERAAALNKQLLTQRLAMMNQQVAQMQVKLDRAEAGFGDGE